MSMPSQSTSEAMNALTAAYEKHTREWLCNMRACLAHVSPDVPSDQIKECKEALQNVERFSQAFFQLPEENCRELFGKPPCIPEPVEPVTYNFTEKVKVRAETQQAASRVQISSTTTTPVVSKRKADGERPELSPVPQSGRWSTTTSKASRTGSENRQDASKSTLFRSMAVAAAPTQQSGIVTLHLRSIRDHDITKAIHWVCQNLYFGRVEEIRLDGAVIKVIFIDHVAASRWRNYLEAELSNTRTPYFQVQVEPVLRVLRPKTDAASTRLLLVTISVLPDSDRRTMIKDFRDELIAMHMLSRSTEWAPITNTLFYLHFLSLAEAASHLATLQSEQWKHRVSSVRYGEEPSVLTPDIARQIAPIQGKTPFIKAVKHLSRTQ